MFRPALLKKAIKKNSPQYNASRANLGISNFISGNS